MAVRLIRGNDPLPEPDESDPRGLLAIGGDLRPARLLDAYRRGIFPWYEEGLPILWHSPDPRMVLEVDRFVVARSLKKRVRRRDYRIALDTDFRGVIEACAEIGRPDQDGTWITRDMVRAYIELHELGWAHCAEAWIGEELVGGVYGVCIGKVFCGESMFALRPDASKVAFVWLVRQLARWGVEVVDCQVHTDHLERFGAREWPRARFLNRLRELVTMPTKMGPWTFDTDFDASEAA